MHRNLMKYLALLAPVVLLIQCTSRFPKPPDPQAYLPFDSLDSLMVRELSSHRVVMFGNSYPGHITYSSLVTSFLESWLDRIQNSTNDTTVPHKLTLALELGQLGEAALNDYLKNGDRYALIRFLIDEQAKFGMDTYGTRDLSVDYVQFCERLRLVHARVDSLNRLLPGLSVSLDILGPEPDPPYALIDVRIRSRQAFLAMKSKWDLFERDRETSSRLVQYISQHPDHRVLICSSSFHSMRDREYGIVLVHLLDSLMERRNVLVIQTSRFPRRGEATPQLEEYRHDRTMPDFIVRAPANPPYPFPFFLVKSQNTLRAMVDLAERYEASPDTLEKDLSRRLLSHSLDLLRRSHLALNPAYDVQIASMQSAVGAATRRAIMTSRTYSDVRRLISHFDPVRDVLEIDSVMTTFAPSLDYFNTLTILLDNLSGKVSVAHRDADVELSTTKQVDTIKANWVSTWKERKSARHVYMLLQILWLGTPGEVSDAMNALKRETGRTFASVTEWDEWWQSTH